jgi:hypothetical protein
MCHLLVVYRAPQVLLPEELPEEELDRLSGATNPNDAVDEVATRPHVGA